MATLRVRDADLERLRLFADERGWSMASAFVWLLDSVADAPSESEAHRAVEKRAAESVKARRASCSHKDVKVLPYATICNDCKARVR